MSKEVPDIFVNRFPSEKDWTLSEFGILGKKYGVGVEDEQRDVKKHGETRINNGIYEVELVFSPRFSNCYFVDAHGNLSEKQDAVFSQPHKLMHVKDVTNFGNILWHWGNTDLDTDGCYLVGTAFGVIRGRKGVTASKLKYKEIYPIIYNLILSNKSKGLKTYVQYKDK